MWKYLKFNKAANLNKSTAKYTTCNTTMKFTRNTTTTVLHTYDDGLR